MVRSVSNRTQRPQLNAECRALKATVSSSLRKCRSRPFDTAATKTLTDSRWMLRAASKAAEPHQLAWLAEAVARAGSSRQLWSVICQINGRSSPPCDLSLASATSHLQALFNKFSSSTLATPDLLVIPILDDPITKLELNAVLDNLKRDKAAGPDGLCNEFFSGMDCINRQWLRSMFNTIPSSSCCPEDWGKIKVILLHKKGDKSDPNNYRGISLINAVTKAFTAVLKRRLATWAESNSLIPEIQSGFRRGRSCTDNIFVLQSVIEERLSRPGGKLYAFFLDFRQAFDSVNHCLLWQKLRSLGVSSRFIATVHSFYRCACAHVSLPHGVSDPIPINNGVLQGDTLSPLLFALFLHDLEDFLLKSDPLIRGSSITASHSILGLLFADDYVHLATSSVQLKKGISGLNAYALANHMVVNCEKSKIMVFRRGGPLRSGLKFLLGEHQLEIVSKFQYLGIWFTPTGGFSVITPTT